MEVMGSSAALIFNTLTGIYLLAILLRFLLQVARADFYNPMSQAVFRITDPMVRIFRSFIPGYKGIDFSSLILALVVEAMVRLHEAFWMEHHCATVRTSLHWFVAAMSSQMMLANTLQRSWIALTNTILL